MSKYQEILEETVAKVKEILKGGEITWEMPWKAGVPRNPTTGKAYRGSNVIILGLHSHLAPDMQWAGYKQWKKAGHQVRKGEHGVQCVNWKPVVTENDNGETRAFMLPKPFTVFGSAQLTEPPDPTPYTPGDVDAWLERRWWKMGVGRKLSDRAAYIPSTDTILLPRPSQFDCPDAYHATAFHETVHATGHKDRLNREIRNKFGDEKYAFEELVAEMGSSFLCSEHGVKPVPRADHNMYVASWLKALDSDPKVLFKAAGKAQAAVDHINNV